MGGMGSVWVSGSRGRRQPYLIWHPRASLPPQRRPGDQGMPRPCRGGWPCGILEPRRALAEPSLGGCSHCRGFGVGGPPGALPTHGESGPVTAVFALQFLPVSLSGKVTHAQISHLSRQGGVLGGELGMRSGPTQPDQRASPELWAPSLGPGRSPSACSVPGVKEQLRSLFTFFQLRSRPGFSGLSYGMSQRLRAPLLARPSASGGVGGWMAEPFRPCGGSLPWGRLRQGSPGPAQVLQGWGGQEE